MILLKYHLEVGNLYNMVCCSSNKSRLPDEIVMKLITDDECVNFIRQPIMGLYNLQGEFISPMYKGELGMPHVTWGYMDNNDGVICIQDLDELEILEFPEARNIIHSIYYDYLNGRHDKAIKKERTTNSNMKERTIFDQND